ncbi:MAG: dehydrogenase [Polaromonas sp.]|jgi:glutathione-regulated potassium-efflux system ancillary protein KefF|nr:dehydrogenase [Polaromonas sp.]
MTATPQHAQAASGAETDIYMLAAHPSWTQSRVTRPLMLAALEQPRVQVRDLYSSYPDYAIDIAAEQVALEKASLVVLLHPIQWYSMPALQKLWLDDVLAYGWAYGSADPTTETSAHQRAGRALRGKDLWLVASTGGPEASYHPQGYNRYFFDAFLPPYEQTASLCGMRFLPPLVLHGAHGQSSDALALHVSTFAERLQTYPAWPEMDDLEQCPSCVVPMHDRPSLAKDA